MISLFERLCAAWVPSAVLAFILASALCRLAADDVVCHTKERPLLQPEHAALPLGLRRRREGERPVLLTMAAYSGTLAAARCLGAHGVSVTMAGDNVLAPARWSRHVRRWVSCPGIGDVERFFDWLVAFGRREPGHVLYPTCDDLAWLFADRAATLRDFFHLYQPSVSTILSVLDKRSLHEHCVELGIPTLPTAYPTSKDEALQVAPDVGFPLLLKPRTQILHLTRGKGIYVENLAELARAYTSFANGEAYHAALLGLRPHIEQPMLQAFRPEAAENIYSLSGFITEADDGVAARGAVKVLQRPRRLGVGLCFEEAPIDPVALDAVVRLCRKVGYFGVFEAEFVSERGRHHLIDFNPRFYGQMGFDVARNLPSPYFVWLAALGQTEKLARGLAESKNWREGQGYVYCNRFFFNLMLSLQKLSGWMSDDEREGWQKWLGDRRARKLAFDSVDAPGDPLPGTVAAAREILMAIRHPRSFYRQMIVGP